jgi:ABC-type phosphate transport system auxiliary subunit
MERQMNFKKMKTAVLDAELEAADANAWRLHELVEMRLEQQREDEALFCDTYSSAEIAKLQEKLETVEERLSALKDERERRLSLSNHARLIEMNVRGEV